MKLIRLTITLILSVFILNIGQGQGNNEINNNNKIIQNDSSTAKYQTFDGKYAIFNDVMVYFNKKGHVLSDREYQLYENLKELVKSKQYQLKNPYSDSLITSLRFELKQEQNYSDSLLLKLSTLRKIHNYHLEKSGRDYDKLEANNDKATAKIDELEKDVDDKIASVKVFEDEATEAKEKVKSKNKWIVGLGTALTGAIAYIYLVTTQ